MLLPLCEYMDSKTVSNLSSAMSHVEGSLNQDAELDCSNTDIQNTVVISKTSLSEELHGVCGGDKAVGTV